MAKLTLRGDGRGAVRAIEDLNKAIGKTDDELNAATVAAGKTERAARRIAEQVEPTKRYNREISNLAILQKKGAITTAQAAAAAQKYRAKLDRVAASGRRAFGGAALSNITKMAGAYIGFQAVLGGVRSVFSQIEEKAQSFADASKTALAAMGELQQLGSLGQDAKYGRELVRRGVFAPEELGQAAKTAFALKSAGLTGKDKELIASAGERRFVDPSQLANLGGALKKVQDVFTPEKIGTLEDTFDKIIVTSKATQSNAASVSKAVTEFGSEAVALNYSPEATLAGFIAIEKQAKNQDVAATRMKSFLSAIDRRGLSRGTLIETVDSITARVQAGENVNTILPNVRAVAAYRNIANQRDLFGGRVSDIANSSGTFQAESQQYLSDPTLRGQVRLARTKGERFFRGQLDAEKELLMERLIEERAVQHGEGFATAMNTMQLGLIDMVGAETISLGSVMASQDTNLSQGLKADITDYFRRVAIASERSAESLEKQEKHPTGRMEK